MKLTAKLAFCAALYLTVPAMGYAQLDLPIENVNGRQFYVYTVKKGDTLYSLSRRLGLTREEIVRNNPAANDGLRAGASLFFPVSEYSNYQPESPASLSENDPIEASVVKEKKVSTSTIRHKVAKGQTLYGLSHQYGVTPEDIIALNPSANYGIKAGEILTIPVKSGNNGNASTSDSPDIRTVNPQSQPDKLRPVNPVIVREDDIDDNEEDRVVNPQPQPDRLRPVNPGIVRDDESDSGEDLPRIVNPQPQPDRLRPVNPEIVRDEDTDDSGLQEISVVDEDNAYSNSRFQEMPRTKVAILLPLMLTVDQPSKQAQLYADFMRGFILAADSLSQTEGAGVDILVLDTGGTSEGLTQALNDERLIGTDLIISPEDESQIEFVGRRAASMDALVFNVFGVQDTTYLANPAIIQANIPHTEMYRKAADALFDLYSGYTPVFMICKGGRSEKLPFTDYLRSRFSDVGIATLDLTFDGALTARDLETLDSNTNYVFIPSSGALTEFNKFAGSLIALRQGRSEQSSIALFGYPDWTTFRGESLENLHSLGATIYSRFYADEKDSRTAEVAAKFNQTFGVPMMQVVPSQALLGFDTANFIIRDIRSNEGEFSVSNPNKFKGLQSAFSFGYLTDDSGAVNNALYIITFLPGNATSTRIL